MEAVIAQLVSSQPGEDTVAFLKKHNDSFAKIKPRDLIQMTENIFSGPQYSIIRCFLLAKAVGEEVKSEENVQRVASFFEGVKNQTNFHLIFDSVNVLSNYLFCHLNLSPLPILNSLYIAVKLVSGPNNDLTFTHYAFVQAAIQYKYYDLAYPIAKRPVYNVNAALFPEFKTKQIELYYYYAGIICAALKDFVNSCKLFRMGLIIPGGNFNAIQFDILKKYYIVSLIETGKRPSLSSLTPNRVSEYFRLNASTYSQLAGAVEALEIQKVEQLVLHDKKSEFFADSNWGLAKQCIEAVKHTRFTRLVETFGSMKFQDLINRTSANSKNESVDTILRLVEAGEVVATINEASETVEFGSTGGGLDVKEKKRALAVATQLQELGRLSNQLSATNDRLLEEPSVVSTGKKK